MSTRHRRNLYAWTQPRLRWYKRHAHRRVDPPQPLWAQP